MADPDHLHERYGPEARYAVAREAELPSTAWEREVARGIELGLPAAESIVDRRIPTFSRGELPHFAGINTFLKATYLEDVRQCGEFDVAVLGAPFDGGTTYRSGARFGPQGIRKISALYGPYSFELGVDLRESITIADLGDVFTIPANIEKTFDQISKAVSHVYASGAFPVVLGGDHSIGYPTVRGVAEHLPGNLGIIHFDRHVDTQETDLDERMHTTPWFHATDIPNVPPKNLVQIGIGGWQAPRPGVKVGRERGTTIMTVTDCVDMGIEAAAARALEVAWDGAEAVWLSFDVDCLDAAFVPGTGWPEPGGFLPREVLRFIQLVAERPLAGIEVVECSPPYDNAEITSLIATRVICDTLGCLVRAGHLPRRRAE
ncbi:agmatinase family protein [Actinophytocola sp.]|uniref:agmatinase family protein n=1 Tax=Actinophytocola sp. TaxID=1872138 RepID=UPI002D7ED1FE|nr:agmatinase family protein [Actinophytocola sp.]HET9141247.1 agmatinase family protein [Actinophytocola sp.]